MAQRSATRSYDSTYKLKVVQFAEANRGGELLGEFIDQNIEVEHMMSVKGKKLAAVVHVDAETLFPNDAIDEDDSHDEEDRKEATGNEGTSVEWWYHRAAVLM